MNTKYSYFLLRLPLALSMLGHGLVRLPKLTEFAEGMSLQFKDSLLPDFLVLPFGYILPILEFVIGILLVIGFQTKSTIYVSLITMSTLIFGSSMIENFSAISSQLVHSIYLIILLYLLPNDRFSIDNKYKL